MIRSLTLALVLLTSTTAFAQDAAPKRPKLMIPLYASNIALNGADWHSTKTALDAGLREGNPLMKNFNPTQMMAVKIASSSAVIAASELLWRRNRIAAVTTMVAANVGLAFVAARNYKLAERW